jgi:hypothetical protein
VCGKNDSRARACHANPGDDQANTSTPESSTLLNMFAASGFS